MMDKQKKDRQLKTTSTNNQFDSYQIAAYLRLLRLIKSRKAKQFLYLKWKRTPTVPSNSFDELEHLRRKNVILQQIRLLETPSTILHWKSIFIKIAAILLIIFGSAIVQRDHIDDSFLIQHQALHKTKTIYLPDSSKIILSPYATISYDRRFGKVNRQVKMIGMVKFDIKKDLQKPFIVTSEHFKVKVLGTSFTIDDSQGNNNKMILVQHGKVSTSILPFGLSPQRILTKNESLSYNIHTNRIIHHIENESLFMNKKGNVTLTEANIYQIANILSREYNISIKVQPSENNQGEITGEFRDKTLKQILEIVRKVMDIEYRIEGKTLKIKEKNM